MILKRKRWSRKTATDVSNNPTNQRGMLRDLDLRSTSLPIWSLNALYLAALKEPNEAHISVAHQCCICSSWDPERLWNLMPQQIRTQASAGSLDQLFWPGDLTHKLKTSSKTSPFSPLLLPFKMWILLLCKHSRWSQFVMPLGKDDSLPFPHSTELLVWYSSK